MYLSSRVLLFSDLNCPFCFTLNEWLNDLGLATKLPTLWSNTHHPLLIQCAIEDDLPHVAAQLRTALFRALWHQNLNISSA